MALHRLETENISPTSDILSQNLHFNSPSGLSVSTSQLGGSAQKVAEEFVCYYEVSDSPFCPLT